MLKRIIIVAVLTGLFNSLLFSQEKYKVSLKDTLDNAFDLSDYVIHMHGFVPYPVIISEPALGGFGGAMAFVFMSPKKSMKGDDQFRFPDVTGVAGMYTLNNTWGGGAMRMGTVPSIGLRYTAAVGYVDCNMDFYRTILDKEVERQFNLKPWFAMADVGENVYKNKIYLGARYMFSKMKVSYDPQLDSLFPRIDSLFGVFEIDEKLGVFGIYADFDFRNSMFTPDKGTRFKATYYFGGSWSASDYDIQRVEAYVNSFFRIRKWWVCGLKAEGQWVNAGAPFYYLPYINMRGIPMMRYQGEATLLFETEQRIDITRRWSAVGFVGTGRTYSDQKYLEDNSWHTAGGVGFRYLLARLFKLRMGIDIAFSKDTFAWYIVMGHFWNRS